MTPVLRWIAVVLLVALVAEGRASAFSVVLAAERFPRSPISAGSGGWRGSQPMTPGGERRVRYGYDVRTARCCRYDVAMSQACLRNSCRLRPGDLVAVSALVPGAHDCELLRLEFTGKERDAETGLDYFGARYMSAAQGRFTSPDPIWVKADRLVDPQRLNLYACGRNNPLRFTDPTGMDIEIGKCAIGTAQDCFNRFQQGLRKEDRSHVRLVTGDGKNGYKKGHSYIVADNDYKSSSQNFQVVQALSNDRSATAELNVVGPKDAIASDLGVKDASGKVTIKDAKSALGMYLTLEQGWFGQTFFQNWGGPAVDQAWYSKRGITEVGVSTDQTVEQMVQTMHHELRHVFLGDFGRAVPKGVHQVPAVPAVDRATEAAEKEATVNRKRP